MYNLLNDPPVLRQAGHRGHGVGPARRGGPQMRVGPVYRHRRRPHPRHLRHQQRSPQ